MKKNKYLDEDIGILNLDEIINAKLKENNILTIRDLWNMNRKSVHELGFSDSDINQIIIQLQLLGLDLNKKIYI